MNPLAYLLAPLWVAGSAAGMALLHVLVYVLGPVAMIPWLLGEWVWGKVMG